MSLIDRLVQGSLRKGELRANRAAQFPTPNHPIFDLSMPDFCDSTNKSQERPASHMAIDWFNERKAAQVAAFFAQKEGESIDVLKLVKLVYLSDRAHMQAYGYPVLNDKFVSMPHGPANSITLNYINGAMRPQEQWDEFVAAREGYAIAIVRQLSEDDFDELSDAEVGTLEGVWARFGGYDKWQLRDWTHENCPEWEDPDGSSEPIPHERVFKFLGCEGHEELADDISADRRIENLFVQLRN